jgi:hypothetical protein
MQLAQTYKKPQQKREIQMSVPAKTSLLLIWILSSLCASYGQDQWPSTPVRDPQALEVLTRVVKAAGGQSVTAIRDISESGAVTSNGNDRTQGKITIQLLGGSRFRVDTDSPKGRFELIVTEGVGRRKGNGRPLPISTLQATNLVNFTTPLGYVTAALADPTTQMRFVGIEQLAGRSVYRLRLKGRLGVSTTGIALTKDIIVDALTSDILRVEDHPFPTAVRRRQSNARGFREPLSHDAANSEIATREIDYTDFRNIDGIRIPFTIAVRSPLQQTYIVELKTVSINSGLTDDSFRE